MTPSMIEQIIKLRKNFTKSPDIVKKLHLSDSNVDRVLQFLGYHGEHELRRCGGIIDYSQDLSDRRYRSIAEYAVSTDTPADKAAIIFKVSRHRLRDFIKARKDAGVQLSSHVAEVPSSVSLTKEYDPCSRSFRTSVAQALKPVEEPEAPLNRPFKGQEAKTKRLPMRRSALGPQSGFRISRAPKLSLDLEPVPKRVKFKPPVDEYAWPTQSITSMVAKARAKAIAADNEALENGEEPDLKSVDRRFLYNSFKHFAKGKLEARAKRKARAAARAKAKELEMQKERALQLKEQQAKTRIVKNAYMSSKPEEYD